MTFYKSKHFINWKKHGPPWWPRTTVKILDYFGRFRLHSNLAVFLLDATWKRCFQFLWLYKKRYQPSKQLSVCQLNTVF